MSLIFVYITNPSKKEAKRIAKHLISKKLAACANIFPIESVYPWEGRIANEKECVLIAKTESKFYPKIVKEIESIHPYKVPCIIRIPVYANKKYESWLMGCLKK